MSFGNRLNQLLLERDMTAATLSRMLGWNTGVISQYLNKPDRDPRLSTAVKVANALGVSVDYLAGLTDDPEPKFIGNVHPGAVSTRDDGTVNVFQVKGSDVHALVDDYEQCTPERRRMLASLARDLRDQSKETGEDSASLDKAVNE